MSSRPSIKRDDRIDRRRRIASLLFLACVLFAVGALPAQLVVSVQVGAIQLALAEVLLACVAALLIPEILREVLYRPIFFVASLALLASLPLTLLAGNQPQQMLAEARGLFVLLIAIAVTATLVRDSHQRRLLLRGTRYILIGSAALVLVSSATGLPLSGRSEAAGLYLASGALQTSEATRLLVPTSHFATGVLCASTALLVSGVATWRQVWSWLTPALVIAILSFSRNTLLALGVAVLVALFVLWRKSLSRFLIRFSSLVLGALTSLGLALLILPLINRETWLGSIVAGFETRVIGGLSAQALSLDTSVRYREREVSYGIEAIEGSPIIGHGLGYAYQPGSGTIGTFWRDQGPYYAHNFYLWMTIKLGVIGLLLFIFVAIMCMSGSYRTALRHAASFGTLGLTAVCAVAPLPLESYSSLTLALFMGAALGLRPRQSRRRSKPVGRFPSRAISLRTGAQ